MNTYAIPFKGYYPVGTCAIVVIDGDRDAAIKQLEEALDMKGLPQTIKPETAIKIDHNCTHIVIPLDGNR